LLNHTLRNSVDLELLICRPRRLRMQETDCHRCRRYCPFFSDMSEMGRYIKKNKKKPVTCNVLHFCTGGGLFRGKVRMVFSYRPYTTFTSLAWT